MYHKVCLDALPCSHHSTLYEGIYTIRSIRVGNSINPSILPVYLVSHNQVPF